VCAGGFFLWRSWLRPVSGGPSPAVSSEPAAQKPPTPTFTPEISSFAPQKGNIVASDVGGVIESITSEYGPGYTGNLLIDGSTEVSWKPRTVEFPQEIIFSFFNRQPALINSLVVTSPSALGPKDVEVWTSATSPTDGFQKIAAQTLNSTGRDQIVSFHPQEATYVKLRVLNGYQPGALEIQEIQIVEGQRGGYTPLMALHPDMTAWKNSPRHAAQRGLEWLQAAAMDWQAQQNCYGCHVQSQVMMGLAISKEGKFVVNDDCLQQLTKNVASNQNPDGSLAPNGAIVTATQFGAMGLSAVDKATGTKNPVLSKSVEWLLQKQQRTGEIPADNSEPPIDQGVLMTTANSAGAFLQVYNETGNIHYKQAAQRALAWIVAAKAETTQDKVFKVIALAHSVDAQQKREVQSTLAQLKAEQEDDGGWQETASMNGSNAFATGEVLYAFKQAGVSVESPEFSRGVRFLLENQKENGAWPSMNSQSARPSDFAPTMWAVIGLADSFREAECAEVERQPDKIIIRMCSRALFDFDRYDLKPDARAVLAGIKSSIIDRYPGTPLGIEGYTDDLGSVAYNMKLSMNRAQSVSQWMQQQGIDATRLKSVGYGQTKPRYPNTGEENRARNRRVEITITLGNKN